MEFTPNDPPREFRTVPEEVIPTKDYGELTLEVGELVSVRTPDALSTASDIHCLSWGFYLTRSCNHQQRRHGWRTGVIANSVGRLYVVVVSDTHTEEFRSFLQDSQHTLVTWVDELGSDPAVAQTPTRPGPPIG